MYDTKVVMDAHPGGSLMHELDKLRRDDVREVPPQWSCAARRRRVGVLRATGNYIITTKVLQDKIDPRTRMIARASGHVFPLRVRSITSSG